MEEKILQAVTLDFILTGLLCGALLGFVLQRGRLCMNSAFRDIIFMKDFIMFRAFLLALGVMIVGANYLNDIGIIELKPQSFYPLANIIGGYLFGIGMVIAGGCGSGVTYRIGEGSIGAVSAFLGFFLGAGLTIEGVLSPLYRALRSVKLEIAGKANATLWEPFGDTMTIKWAVIAIVTVGILLFILKAKPFSFGKQKGFYWSITGALVGLIGIFTFWASQNWGGGFARGMNFTTPTAELFYSIFNSNAKSMFFPMVQMGPVSVTWAEFFVIGTPIGALISAKILKEFSWKWPPTKEALTVFAGGVLMGFSGITGGGCNIGQGLTGVCTLSIGSISALIAMILGNWTMVYFKFIRPMNDME